MKRKMFVGINIFFIIFSLVFTYFVFSKFSNSQIIFAHDQQLYFSLEQIFRESFTRISNNGGLDNLITLSIRLPTLIFYFLGFIIKLSIHQIQFILFFTSLVIYLSLSFFGFYKLYSTTIIDLRRRDWFNIIVVTIFYCFSIYIVESTNSGFFWSINYIFTYSLFPLIFYYLDKFITNHDLSYSDIFRLVIILFLSSSFVIFFAPIVIASIVYVIIKTPFKSYLKFNYLKIGTLILFFLSSFYYFGAYILNARVTMEPPNSGLINSTAGLQQGGLLSLLLFNISWALNYFWQPRNILTYSTYYTNIIYYLTVLSIYFIIFAQIVKNSKLLNKIKFFLLIFLISLFVGKGPQSPFGFIYNFLIENFQFLYVIRSPAGKMGFVMVFTLACVIMYMLQISKKTKWLSLYIVGISIFISFPFFTTESILGRTVPGQSGNFITSISREANEVLEVLNNDENISNVLVYPNSDFISTIDADNDIYIGQDKLSMLSRQPFIYELPLSSRDINAEIQNFIKSKDFSSLGKLNARYVLLNKSLSNSNSTKLDNLRSSLNKNRVKLLIDNKDYELYLFNDDRFKQRLHIVSDKANISYKYESPVKYSISIRNLGVKETLALLENFNPHFKIYPEKSSRGTKRHMDFVKLFKKPLANTSHKKIYNYANSWEIDPDQIKKDFSPSYYVINQDGTMSINLTLYYLPQAVYDLILYLSSLSLLICAAYLYYASRRSKNMK